MSAYGGAAGYRPRVQSAYYMRVYRHIWQASIPYMGARRATCNFNPICAAIKLSLKIMSFSL